VERYDCVNSSSSFEEGIGVGGGSIVLVLLIIIHSIDDVDFVLCCTTISDFIIWIRDIRYLILLYC